MNLFLTPHQKSQQMSFDNAVAVSNYLNRKNRRAKKSQLKSAQTSHCDMREKALETQELYGA